MIPPVRNTMVRAPLALQASRKLPGPEAFRLVTSITLPLRPPMETAPHPYAPGKAGVCAAANMEREVKMNKVKSGFMNGDLFLSFYFAASDLYSIINFFYLS